MPTSISYPLKEFTVYPKAHIKKSNNNNDKKKEVLLMLKEDGSFQQYSSEEQAIPDKLRFFNNDRTKVKADEDNDVLDRYCEFGKLKGKWSLVGGRLILAADRPMDDYGQSDSSPKRSNDITDTILEGEVVATTEEGLLDNPVLGDHKDDTGATTQANSISGNDNGNDSLTGSSDESNHDSKSSTIDSGEQNEKNTKHSRSAGNTGSVLDTHLSVPKGQVNIGRFTYPTHHPSFFDAPMFNPKAGGKFELRQVLGTLNTQQKKDDDEFEEKFSPSDFYNKTFLLSSSPIPEFQPKGNKRWSIKYNKFVEDPPRKSKKKDEQNELDQLVHNIRVLELKFFANNTFATIGGMGGSAILRGRFSVIGENRDHIWMQVMRFGFGRSVSGSVFSEGRSLSKDDEKAYWGKIKYVNNQDSEADEKSEGVDSHNTPISSSSSSSSSSISEKKLEDSGTKNGNEDQKLIVKGSVLFGYGLEPLPIALFVLTETNSAEEYDEDEDDDDDDDDSDDVDNDPFSLDSDNVFQ